jgi:SAM-dependent methyltransferase
MAGEKRVEMRANLVESVVRPIARALVPGPVRPWARDILNAFQVRRNPARIALVSGILPAYARLGGRILWIGCRRYTKGYGRMLTKHGGECWTTDIEPKHAKWGRKHRHFTCDVVRIDELIPSEAFDTVLCNGVFGFGVDTCEAQLAALQAMGGILKPGGRLLLGWNTERVEDPGGLAYVRAAFVGDDLLGRGPLDEIPEAGYVYRFLRRLGN